MQLQDLKIGGKYKTVNDYNVKFLTLVREADFTDIDTNLECLRLY